MKTNQKTMAAADWDKVERETISKIRILKAVVQEMETGPLSDKICNDLVLPALATLGSFNSMVEIHEDRANGESDVELRNTTGPFTDSFMTTIERGDCPHCGAYASRCSMDRHKVSVCGVTGKPMKRCAQCDRPLITELEDTRCVVCTDSLPNR